MKCLAIAVIVAALGTGVAAAATCAVARAQDSSDLQLEQTARELAEPGSHVTYSVTVTNHGPDAASDVLLLDPLPADMTFVSITAPRGWRCTLPAIGDNGMIECTSARLDLAAVGRFVITAQLDPGVLAGTSFANVATVSAANIDPSRENDGATAVVQTPPPTAADLSATLQVQGAADPDTDVSYTVALRNAGPGAADGVTLTQRIPGNMRFVSFTQTSGPSSTCSRIAAEIICAIETLAADASATFSFVGHTPSVVAEGSSYASSVTVSSDYHQRTEFIAGPSRRRAR